MQNVKISLSSDKKTLTIKIDLSKAGVESKSGKSMVVASTQGNVVINPEDQTKLGLNVYRPIDES